MASTDQLSAHLDRGWERYARGDLEGAERSARTALAAAPKSPEALCLLGSTLSLAGRREEAMECFQQAMEEEDGYIEPILGAAELWLRGFSEPDRCIRLCDELLSFAEEPDDIAEASLLKLEALLDKRDNAAALSVLEKISDDLSSGPLLYRLGHCCYELEQYDAAERHFKAAISFDPNLSDAHYELGTMLRELGREDEGRASLWASYTLDVLQEKPAKENAQEVAEHTRAGLPPGMRALLGGAPLLLAPRIGPELVAEGFDPRALCFFAGQPAEPKKKTKPHLERIFVYWATLSLYGRTPEEWERELRAALLAEAAEFFQLSDRELADRGVSPDEL